MDAVADSLEVLLGKSEADYRVLLPEGRPLVLYGAGTLGRAVLKRLRAAGVEPLAFADDTPAKQGQAIDGLNVFRPEDIFEQSNSDALFAVTILNPAIRFLEARKNLRLRTGRDAISLFTLGRMFPALLPYLQYDSVNKVLANRDEIRRAFDVFGDTESCRQFAAHIEFRLTANYEALPEKSQPPYFPCDLIGELPGDCSFIDCGAYDGDTIRQFLLHQRGRFGTIHAFEPDRLNYAKLSAYINSLGSEISSRVHLHHGAVGDHSREIAFHETGDMSAAISDDGTGRVAMFALGDILQRDNSSLYIKFDIEGFEMQALHGARRILREQRSMLAVSIYHRPEDIWTIPLYLHDLNLGYRLALRTEGEDGMDVVCYAVR